MQPSSLAALVMHGTDACPIRRWVLERGLMGEESSGDPMAVFLPDPVHVVTLTEVMILPRKSVADFHGLLAFFTLGDLVQQGRGNSKVT